MTREHINHFFKVHGESTDRCHEPNENCDRTAIRAHSIPSSAVLTRLAENGHLVMPRMKLKVPPPAEISFERVGKNQATTFTGLCSQHDNDIFRAIDGVPNLGDPSHLFLLAYRAVLREYYVCLQNAWRFQSTYQKTVEVGDSPGTEPSEFGLFTMNHLVNTIECHVYKLQFDQFYLNRNWSQLQSHIIVLKDQSPSIAVSSMFTLDDVLAPERPRVTVSVFPVGPDVNVVFSAVPNDAPFVTTYLDRVLSSDGYFQKYLLSKLILQSCDNFVLAPSYYDALSQDHKDALCQFYIDTIRENANDHEDERLYLF